MARPSDTGWSESDPHTVIGEGDMAPRLSPRRPLAQAPRAVCLACMVPRAPTSIRQRAAFFAVATLLAACGGKPKEAETPEASTPLQEDVPPDISEDPTNPG